MTSESARLSRRTVTTAAVWTTPLVAYTVAAPAFAASRVAVYDTSGLFVTATGPSFGYGYSESNSTNGATSPTTPQAYFKNPKAATSTGPQGPTTGAGSFTPVTNATTAGNYASTSGFWWSVPTTAPNTGTGYIAGSTATLKKGAVFFTDVTIIFNNDPGQGYADGNVKIDNQTWGVKSAPSGTRAGMASTSPYLGDATVAGTWSTTKATVTQDPTSKNWIFKGTITYTTSADQTITQTGSVYYGQALIMPARIAGIGAIGITLASRLASATISYTVPAPGTAPAKQTLTNTLLTTVTSPQ